LPTTAVLWAAAVVAWIGTVVWVVGRDMQAMPGTMGLGFGEFVAMWALMMAAMMLPSVSPFVTAYAKTVTMPRTGRLLSLAVGYLAAWAVAGVVAYALARAFGSAAERSDGVARTLAVGSFAAAGVYQLTPLKRRCLSHCRSPIGHLFHYLSFRGPTRDLRAGFLHGLYCLGCCWGLMLLLVAFGVMNLLAMVGVAVVIAVEKLWRHGERFAQVVAVAALAYAVAVAFVPEAAPGLDPGRAGMDEMQMEMDEPSEQGPMPTGAPSGTAPMPMDGPSTTMSMGG
jgi:predicted metal-binding membrane protein